MKVFNKVIFPLIAVSVVCGCIAPRTGAYFQSTKSNRNDAAWANFFFYGIELSPFVIPFVLFLPTAGLGYSLDHYVCSPIYDIVNLPLDFYLRCTGPNVKVVDFEGNPIPHALVNAPIVTSTGTTYSFVGETDERGLFHVPLSWRNSTLKDGEVNAEGFVTTPLVSPRLLWQNGCGTTWQKAKDGAIQHEVVMQRKGEDVVPVLKSVVLKAEQDKFYDLDIVVGDWCPPYGKGKVQDISFCLSSQRQHRGNTILEIFLSKGNLRRSAGIVRLKELPPESVDLSNIIGTNCLSHVTLDMFEESDKRFSVARIRGNENPQWAFHTTPQHGIYGILKYESSWGDVNSYEKTLVLQYIYNPILDCPCLKFSKGFAFPLPPKQPPKFDLH